MNGKTKSILLQVAFKEAAAYASDIAAVKAVTSRLYTDLIALHDELDINPDEGGGRGGGRSFGGGGAPKKAAPASVTTFTDGEGVVWSDYRKAKAGSEVPSGHPDFKAGQKSIWIYDPNGTPKPEGQELAKIADDFAALAAPM